MEAPHKSSGRPDEIHPTTPASALKPAGDIANAMRGEFTFNIGSHQPKPDKAPGLRGERQTHFRQSSTRRTNKQASKANRRSNLTENNNTPFDDLARITNLVSTRSNNNGHSPPSTAANESHFPAINPVSYQSARSRANHRRSRSTGVYEDHTSTGNPNINEAHPNVVSVQTGLVEQTSVTERHRSYSKSRLGLPSFKFGWPLASRSSRAKSISTVEITKRPWSQEEMASLGEASLRYWHSGHPVDYHSLARDWGRSSVDVREMLHYMLHGYFLFEGGQHWPSEDREFMLYWTVIEFPKSDILSRVPDAPSVNIATSSWGAQCLSALMCKSRLPTRTKRTMSHAESDANVSIASASHRSRRPHSHHETNGVRAVAEDYDDDFVFSPQENTHAPIDDYREAMAKIKAVQEATASATKPLEPLSHIGPNGRISSKAAEVGVSSSKVRNSRTQNNTLRIHSTPGDRSSAPPHRRTYSAIDTSAAHVSIEDSPLLHDRTISGVDDSGDGLAVKQDFALRTPPSIQKHFKVGVSNGNGGLSAAANIVTTAAGPSSAPQHRKRGSTTVTNAPESSTHGGVDANVHNGRQSTRKAREGSRPHGDSVSSANAVPQGNSERRQSVADKNIGPSHNDQGTIKVLSPSNRRSNDSGNVDVESFAKQGSVKPEKTQQTIKELTSNTIANIDSKYPMISKERKLKVRRFISQFVRIYSKDFRYRAKAYQKKKKGKCEYIEHYGNDMISTESKISSIMNAFVEGKRPEYSARDLAFHSQLLRALSRTGDLVTYDNWSIESRYATDVFNAKIELSGLPILEEYLGEEVLDPNDSTNYIDPIGNVRRRMPPFKKESYVSEAGRRCSDSYYRTFFEDFNSRVAEHGFRPVPTTFYEEEITTELLDNDIEVRNYIAEGIEELLLEATEHSKRIGFTRGIEEINQRILNTCGLTSTWFDEFFKDAKGKDGPSREDRIITEMRDLKKLPSEEQARVLGKSFAKKHFNDGKVDFFTLMLLDHPFWLISLDFVRIWRSKEEGTRNRKRDYPLFVGLLNYLENDLGITLTNRFWLCACSASILSMIRRVFYAMNISHTDYSREFTASTTFAATYSSNKNGDDKANRRFRYLDNIDINRIERNHKKEIQDDQDRRRAAEISRKSTNKAKPSVTRSQADADVTDNDANEKDSRAARPNSIFEPNKSLAPVSTSKVSDRKGKAPEKHYSEAESSKIASGGYVPKGRTVEDVYRKLVELDKITPDIDDPPEVVNRILEKQRQQQKQQQQQHNDLSSEQIGQRHYSAAAVGIENQPIPKRNSLQQQQQNIDYNNGKVPRQGGTPVLTTTPVGTNTISADPNMWNAFTTMMAAAAAVGSNSQQQQQQQQVPFVPMMQNNYDNSSNSSGGNNGQVYFTQAPGIQQNQSQHPSQVHAMQYAYNSQVTSNAGGYYVSPQSVVPDQLYPPQQQQQMAVPQMAMPVPMNTMAMMGTTVGQMEAGPINIGLLPPQMPLNAANAGYFAGGNNGMSPEMIAAGMAGYPVPSNETISVDKLGPMFMQMFKYMQEQQQQQQQQQQNRYQ